MNKKVEPMPRVAAGRISAYRFTMLSLVLLTASACEETEPAVDASIDTSIDTLDDRVIDPSCNPALTLTEPTHVAVQTVHSLTPTGGSGAYRFEFVENGSGARLQERGGDYLAGPTAGVTDVIRITDDGCEGELEHRIEVLFPMEVRPMGAVIGPMTSLTIDVTGGSGSYSFETTLMGSGGTVDMATGLYMAGSVVGRDIIEVRDTNTDELAEVVFDVVETGGLRLTAGRLGLAQGSWGTAPVLGGTGYYDLSAADEGILSFSGAEIFATGNGSTIVTVRDRYTGDEITLPVTAMTPAQDTLTRQGNTTEERRATAAGDLNGDGFPDVVVGMSEADAAGNNSGAVYVFAGSPSGFITAPAQILSPENRNERFGASIELADVNGDGEQDLVVGAPLADAYDEGRRWYQSGAIYVYHGVTGGFFNESPQDVMRGLDQYDQNGWSIAVCDFNGDGRLDIAAGATEAEERDAARAVIGAGAQGAINTYFGSAGGFAPSPDHVVWGSTFRRTGAFEPVGSTRLGRMLAAGDFDGDGVCDLAAHMSSPHRDWGRNYDGAIMIFHGERGGSGSAGGLREMPSRALVGRMPNATGSQTNASGWLGFEIRVSDLNGDMLDDLVIGHPYYDDLTSTPARADIGAVYVLLGSTERTTVGTGYEMIQEQADAYILGTEAGGHFGRGIVIGDLDGDGTDELAVGAPAAERTPYPSNSGEIYRVVLNHDGGTLGMSLAEWAGYDVNNARWGQGLGITPNPDGSEGMGLIVLSRYDSTNGDYVGGFGFVPYLPAAGEEPATFGVHTHLEYPGEGSGAHLGFAADVVGDITSNGYADMVVGAMEMGVRGVSTSGLRQGVAYLYEGQADGFDLSGPAVEMRLQNGMHNDGLIGSVVSNAGDFNNDGEPDFAVIGRGIDRTSNLRGVTRGPSAACGGNRTSNPGATFIYLSQPTADHGLSQPGFIYYGPRNGFYVNNMVGGFDYNGDGYDDLLLGAFENDVPGSNAGAIAFIPGRADDGNPATTQEICADAPGTGPTLTGAESFDGFYANHNYGKDVAVLGDVNGDGCDEVAVGHPQYGTDTTRNPRYGAVDIMFGWSPVASSPCPRERRVLRMVGMTGYRYVGGGLAAGLDFDEDGLPDLIATSEFYNSSQGAAWILRGSYVLANMPTTPLEYVTFQEPGLVHPAYEGNETGASFGWNAALVPNLAGDGRPGIAFGNRLAGAYAEYQRRQGEVTLHRILNGEGGPTIEALPQTLIPGESSTYDPRFGERIRGVTYGSPGMPRHGLLIPSPYSQAIGEGWGTAWLLPAQP